MAQDELLTAITAAHQAAAEDYMLWATLDHGTAEIALVTVRLPLGTSPAVSLARVRTLARTALASAGVVGREADSARLHLERLPPADEVRGMLDRLARAGEELALVDFPIWEAIRKRLNLEPKPAEIGGEPEIIYGNLRIRRSAVS